VRLAAPLQAFEQKETGPVAIARETAVQTLEDAANVCGGIRQSQKVGRPRFKLALPRIVEVCKVNDPFDAGIAQDIATGLQQVRVAHVPLFRRGQCSRDSIHASTFSRLNRHCWPTFEAGMSPRRANR